MRNFHTDMMKRALRLARRGLGRTSPNPAVGCVIVKDGTVIGEGWHHKAGTPHAEVHALREAGAAASGSDVYVTLEPCAHHGRTPPCAEALIEAQVAKVYVGMIDPNPLVQGKGVDILQKAGIAVMTGLIEEDCRRLNESFIKHVTVGRPFVILKTAMTLDGKTAAASGDSKWITNALSRAYVHKLRGMVDAVMVGVGTVAIDDPQLTCRTGRGKNPIRIIVDSTLKIPLHAHVLKQSKEAETIIATTCQDESRIVTVGATGATVLQCLENDGRVDLTDLFTKLGKIGIQSVLLEGGATLAGEALRKGMIDKFLFFYAPKLVGGISPGPFSGSGVERIADAALLRNITVRRFGSDILVEGYPEAVCLPA